MILLLMIMCQWMKRNELEEAEKCDIIDIIMKVILKCSNILILIISV